MSEVNDISNPKPKKRKAPLTEFVIVNNNVTNTSPTSKKQPSNKQPSEKESERTKENCE